MHIVRFDAELMGNKQVLVNGHAVQDPRALGEVDEKLIEKTVDLDQQWQMLTLLKRMTAQLEHVYRKSMVRAGQAPAAKVIVSGLYGVPGTDLGHLGKK
jgi:hypothetical protein